MGISVRHVVLFFAGFICITSISNATPMIEDVVIDVDITTRTGKNLVIRSDGDTLSYFRFSSEGRARVVDVSFVKDLAGASISNTKIYLDGASDEVPDLVHVLVPFDEWRGAAYDELDLMLTFENVRLIGAVVIVNGDFDRPLHVFKNEMNR